MARDLMKKKLFDESKINNELYQIIIDDVHFYSFDSERITGSVKITKEGKTTYQTKMIVAIIERDNIVIPLDFEPIENIGIIYNKQDCELNAAKRMIKRIKENFKRLKICLSGDALYFNDPFISIIEQYNWKYLITYKDGCSKEVKEFYETASRYKDIEVIEEKGGRYEYYNGVEFKDKKVNIIKLVTSEGQFNYGTDIEISKSNYKEIMEYGRKRWKIENNCFNELKNAGYNLTHAYSYNENAVKAHFGILLIAHIIMQLLEMYEKNNGRFETIKELAEEIKEALRTTILSAAEFKEILLPIHMSRVLLQIV